MNGDQKQNYKLIAKIRLRFIFQLKQTPCFFLFCVFKQTAATKNLCYAKLEKRNTSKVRIIQQLEQKHTYFSLKKMLKIFCFIQRANKLKLP